MSNKEKYPDPQQEIERMMNEEIGDRHNEMVSNLEGLSCDTEPIKKSNDEWKKYILNLSKTIAGNTTQLSHLMNILNDGFLKELNGRIDDLNGINNVYYEEDDGDTTFVALKQDVDQRHGEISNDVEASRVEIMKQLDRPQEETQSEDVESEVEEEDSNVNQITSLYDGLLGTNSSWNELMKNCSSMHTESQGAKTELVNQLMRKYARMEQLMGRVSQLPATKLL